MSSALVGATGFVGGNLQRQHTFDDLYSSANIEQIVGRSYDLIVTAGAPAVKWKANREPEQDLANLQRLMDCMAATHAERVVLISTVDVYPDPVGVDESASIDRTAGAPYGRHRLMLEDAIREQFATTILRLPGLFGPGLKKNIIYDLLHDNQVEKICPESVFQFYSLPNLWRDVETTIRNEIQLVNVATEPISVGALAREAFGIELTRPPGVTPARYDFRSRFAEVYGGTDGYLYGRNQVLDDLRRFVHDEGWPQA